MLTIKKFVFSPFSENTYIIFDEETKEAAVVDPGCLEQSEEEIFHNFVESNSIKINFLINTHCHLDHIFGNAFVKEKYGAEFYAPEDDIFLLSIMVQHSKEYGIEMKPSPQPDKFITEEMKLSVGSSELKFLFTPGHSPGEFCIFLEKEKKCITGDVLFNGGIGRTDLWGGSYEKLINSIKTKLFTLPDDIEIYPGHGEASTIGDERMSNPFLIDG